MGRPVVADQPGPVHGEHHVEPLQAHVVDDLVIGALQERRVDRRHRLAALERQPGREQDRLLLGDADVVVAVRQRALQQVQAGARVHRRGDPDHPLVAVGLGDQRLAEHLRVGGRRRLDARSPLDRHRRRRGAVGDRLGLGGMPLLHPLQAAVLGGGKALALDGGAMHDHRSLGRQRLAQRAAQLAHVVAVDHAHVGEVELLPPQARGPEGLDRLLDVGPEPLERGTEPGRQLGQAALDALAGVPQLRVEPDAVEISRHGAHIGRDRHAVVVQNHDDRRSLSAGLVHGLEGHAAGQGPVSGHGHHVPVRSAAAPHRLLDPDGVADRRGCVPGAHDVVLGLADRAERRQSLIFADRVQLIAAAGEDLVGVGLVADVPQDLVAGGVEQRVQRHRDLAGAQVGAEVAADLPDGVDDVLADLLGHLLQLLVGQAVEVLWLFDALEEVGHQ